MGDQLTTANRRIRKRLASTTKYVYGLGKDLARVQGRIDCGHYAARVVNGELIPERDRLQLTIDTEKAYAERDALRVAEQYRARTHDHAGADELAESVADFVEHQMGSKQAIALLSLYFDDGSNE